MDKIPVIILIDPNIMVRTRIREFLANERMEIIEVLSPMALMSIMSERDYKINLIITDIEAELNAEFAGVNVVSLVRSKSPHVPIMVLSSVGKKEVITRYILLGATEYILKPFEDAFLKAKILKYLSLEVLHTESVLKFNLRDYLNSEIYKAQKGRYCFTLLKIDFPQIGAEKGDRENVFYNNSDALYANLKSLFWDGDLYIQYGFQSHLGFFPFSDKNTILHLRNKIDKRFNEFKATKRGLADFGISHTFACYPDDGSNANELLLVLSERDKNHVI